MALRDWQPGQNPPETEPSIIKTYESRPQLPIRIFFPESYRYNDPVGPEGARPPLPTLFTIHGGGFVFGDPSDNDAWNYIFSNLHNALVIALNYAKAPGSPFPGAVADLEALVPAVLADPDLAPCIRQDKVGMAGFSAGGNLTLSINENPAIREKITAGVVPIYPPVDFSVPPKLKSETRRYKPALGGVRGADKDFLLDVSEAFNKAYIPEGHDVRDPLLSPFFADRSTLPRRIWVIGCELDMLGHEAWRTASRLAGRKVPGLGERIGQEEPGKPGVLITDGDERFAWEEKNGDGEVKWLCVPDAVHGFDMEPAAAASADEATREDGYLKRDEVIRLAGEWLFGQ